MLVLRNKKHYALKVKGLTDLPGTFNLHLGSTWTSFFLQSPCVLVLAVFTFFGCYFQWSAMSDSSIALTKAWRSRRQLFNSLRWPIYVFNSVVTFSTQLLPAILSHRRSTIVSLETYPFIPLPDSLVTNTNIVGKRYLVDQSYPGWPRLCITNVSSPASSWPQGNSLSLNEWSFFF